MDEYSGVVKSDDVWINRTWQIDRQPRRILDNVGEMRPEKKEILHMGDILQIHPGKGHWEGAGPNGPEAKYIFWYGGRIGGSKAEAAESPRKDNLWGKELEGMACLASQEDVFGRFQVCTGGTMMGLLSDGYLVQWWNSEMRCPWVKKGWKDRGLGEIER